MYPARLLDGVLPNNKQFSYKLMVQYMIVMQRSLSIGVKSQAKEIIEKGQGDHYELTYIYCFCSMTLGHISISVPVFIFLVYQMNAVQLHRAHCFLVF